MRSRNESSPRQDFRARRRCVFGRGSSICGYAPHAASKPKRWLSPFSCSRADESRGSRRIWKAQRRHRGDDRLCSETLPVGLMRGEQRA
jgi:hypothetical protein